MNKLILSTLFLTLLVSIGQHVVNAEGGSKEEKERRDSAPCLVKEPTSSEESDSHEDCSAFTKLPTPLPPTQSPTTVGPTGPPCPTSQTATSSTGASSTSGPSSSSGSPPPTSSSGPTDGTTEGTTEGTSEGTSEGTTDAPCVSVPDVHHRNCSSRSRLKHSLVAALVHLDDTEKQHWKDLVVEIENEVLCNPCGCLSDEEKVVKAGKKVKKHFSKHPSHAKKLKYKSLGHSKWGHFRDFVTVGIDILAENIDITITIDINDECPLFDAMRNATKNHPTCSVSTEELIVKMRKDFKHPDYSKTQKRGLGHRKMKSHFKLHPECEEMVDDEEVHGHGGDIGSFRRVFKVAHQTTRLRKVISGSNDNDCELLFKMSEVSNNVSVNITERLSMKQLHDVIQANFTAHSNLAIRLQCVSQQVWELLKVGPWLVELIMDLKCRDLEEPINPPQAPPVFDDDCSCDENIIVDVYELSYCSHLCTEEDSCEDAEAGEATEPTEAPTTVTPPATTGSTAGPTSSSKAPPTSSSAIPPTSTPPVVCSNRPPVVHKLGNSYSNASWLEYSIQVVVSGWSLSQKSSYSPYFNRVKRCINELTAYPEGVACLNKNDAFKASYVVPILEEWNGNNPALQAPEMDIVIKGSSVHGFYGKVRDFCNCE